MTTDAELREWVGILTIMGPPEAIVQQQFLRAAEAALSARAENTRLREALDDAIDLLGGFAGSYLSEDGKTVIETRGSMGRRLARLWAEAHALLGEPPQGSVP